MVEREGNENVGWNNKRESSKSDSPSMDSAVLVQFWSWLSAIPHFFAHMYKVVKSGELLSRVPLLDAMMQFFIAVATSCHPQGHEDLMNDRYEDEHKSKKNENGGRKLCDGVEVFGGTGRTLRSRTVDSK